MSEYWKFWVGKVAVPILVAVGTIIAVMKTGIFDAQSKYIEAASIKFQNDTIKYSNERARLIADNAILRNDSINKANKIIIDDSILHTTAGSMSEQQKKLAKLTFENQNLNANNTQLQTTLKDKYVALRDTELS